MLEDVQPFVLMLNLFYYIKFLPVVHHHRPLKEKHKNLNKTKKIKTNKIIIVVIIIIIIINK